MEEIVIYSSYIHIIVTIIIIIVQRSPRIAKFSIKFSLWFILLPKVIIAFILLKQGLWREVTIYSQFTLLALV